MNLKSLYSANAKHFLFIIVLAFQFASCGKKAEKKNSDIERNRDEIRDVDELISKQTVECARGEDCPEALAKVVVADGSRLRTCTGFLVTSEIMATSASCLTPGLRAAEDRCSGEVFSFFPKVGAKPAQKIGCESIIRVSTLVGSDPVLWRQDLTYFKLPSPILRRPLFMSRDGVKDNSIVRSWKLDMVNNEAGIIRKQDCKVVHQTYVNPLADSEFSPNFVITGCDFISGNRGAPLLNERNRWVGLMSQYTDKELVKFIESTGLLTASLKPLAHASNAACLPSSYDDDDYPEEVECRRDLNTALLDETRSNMLNPKRLYAQTINKTQSYLEALRPYFKWDVEVINHETMGDAEIKFKPQCFSNIKDWIRSVNGSRYVVYSFQLPNYRLKLSITPDAKFAPIIKEEGDQKYFVQFNPRELLASRSSQVFLWPENLPSIFNSNLSENCL
jgi:hypothetical protein